MNLSDATLEELIKELEKRGCEVTRPEDIYIRWEIREKCLGDGDFTYRPYKMCSKDFDKLYEDLKTNKELFNDFLEDLKDYVTEKEFIEIISTNSPLTQESLTRNIVEDLVYTYMNNIENESENGDYGPGIGMIYKYLKIDSPIVH